METLLHSVLSNAVWAVVLAVGATVAGRAFRQRPGLVHGLWLLVLVKLVTPSFVHLAPSGDTRPTTIKPAAVTRPAVAPRVSGIARPPIKEVAASPRTSVTRTVPSPMPRHPRFDITLWPWRTITVVLWVVGAAAWWLVLAWRVSRFRRLLRTACPAPEALCDRVRRLATDLGLRRAPAVWLVPAEVPPMLWAPFGPPRLLLPENLWDRLDEKQRDAVLVHELAHLGRRDHWVRWLEAVVLGLYWWDPVAWWARRRVEEAEEQCCDAWVVWALPGAAEAYAEALVATAVFLSGACKPWPAGATGVGRVFPLRRRLSMILRDPITGSTARPAPRAALIVGILFLLFLPVWGAARPAKPIRLSPEVSSGTESKVKTTVRVAPPAEAPLEPRPAKAVVALATVPRVSVSQPLVREVTDYLDFVGRIEAAQTIEIRARVGGALIKVYSRAGQMVERGESLFEIDPRPYRLEWDKAEAEMRRCEAHLKRQSAEWEQAKSLRARQTIAQGELDRIEGERDEAEASLQSARATRDLAKLKLDFTKVNAPINGKISRPRIAAGDLVAADTTVLATLSSSDPLYVGFNVPELTVLKFGREKRAGKATFALEPGLPIQMGIVDEDDFPRRGKIDSIDTRFDPAEGTIHCRAIVPNSDGLLIPGLSARVRLAAGAPYRAILVSEGAMLLFEGAQHVMVLGDRDAVEYRPVKVGELHGDLRVVTEGLKEDDWVVVDHLNVLQAGMAIEPKRIAMPTRFPTPGHGGKG